MTIELTPTFSIVDGKLFRNGFPFTPNSTGRNSSPAFRGLNGALIEPFVVGGVSVRRITYGGETWYEPAPENKFVGPAEARSRIGGGK